MPKNMMCANVRPPTREIFFFAKYIESIPKFTGGPDESPDEFVARVVALATTEGWDDGQRIQVAVRRLGPTVADWHVRVGNTHAAYGATGQQHSGRHLQQRFLSPTGRARWWPECNSQVNLFCNTQWPKKSCWLWLLSR